MRENLFYFFPPLKGKSVEREQPRSKRIFQASSVPSKGSTEFPKYRKHQMANVEVYQKVRGVKVGVKNTTT